MWMSSAPMLEGLQGRKKGLNALRSDNPATAATPRTQAAGVTAQLRRADD
jgi:hypothetical protein